MNGATKNGCVSPSVVSSRVQIEPKEATRKTNDTKTHTHYTKMTINYLPFSFHLERYHLRFGKQNQRIEQIPSITTAIDMWNVCGILSYENVCWLIESGAKNVARIQY